MNMQAPGRLHAKIAPSSLGRLFACPGSHALSEGLAPTPPSVYAAHGTAAHTVAESCLLGSIDADTFLGDIQTHDGFDIEVDEEMVEGVQMYLDEARRSVGVRGWKFWVEQKVDLTPVFPDGLPDPIYGTADFIGWHKKTSTLRIVDLKFGRGGVSPVNNPQAYAYALGVVLFLRDILGGSVPRGWFPDNIEVTIVQPRGIPGEAGVKTETFTGLDLQMWADDVFVPGVKAVYSPHALLTPGDHCHFCPAKAICPALAAQTKAIARASFDELPVAPTTLSDADLAGVLDWATVISQWVEAVRAEASRRIDMGGTVPGWKLVPKRAVRKWVNPEATLDTLVSDYKLPIADVAKIVPHNPTQIEKKFPLVYDDLATLGAVDKTSSGTTLAPDHDPRDAVLGRSAKELFSVLDE